MSRARIHRDQTGARRECLSVDLDDEVGLGVVQHDEQLRDAPLERGRILTRGRFTIWSPELTRERDRALEDRQGAGELSSLLQTGTEVEHRTEAWSELEASLQLRAGEGELTAFHEGAPFFEEGVGLIGGRGRGARAREYHHRRGRSSDHATKLHRT